MTGVDLFNAVMMHHKVDQRLVLLVECSEDCGVVDPHLNETDLQSYPGYGKKSVVEAAGLLDANGVTSIAPIVDADFDRFTGADKTYTANVILTEFYDIDADVMFHCPDMIKSVTYNFSSHADYSAYSTTWSISAADLVTRLSLSVGVLRYLSVTHSVGLFLRNFPMHRALDGFEAGSLHSFVLAMGVMRSSAGVTPPTVADMEATLAPWSDRRLLCSGHDLVGALGALIRGRWGGANVGNEVLAGALRAAVSCACWSRTVVFAAVRDWAQTFGVVAWTCA
ncbi:hypothetical protein [Kribbella catacumbae]|uniref:hypothetical protein n=1 Tax=Kribbella catacumbae TaxID=460086 RepID=UPI0012F762E1|nr:hypothetical protein [Kribbella catacumbae]